MAARSRSHLALGATLRSARLRAGLSQRTLAARAGVSQSHISAIERAQTDPTYETLLKLTDALGVGLGELLAAAGSPTI
jgi:transcriptional regulator with XRE-family HTH domain